MASGAVQLLVCFAFVCVVCGQSAQISMTPANLVTMPTGTLEIKCSRGGSFNEIFTVGLKKEGTSSVSNIVTYTSSGVTHDTSNSDNMEGRSTVTGSLSTTDLVLLTVSLNSSQVRCSDAGTYMCQILGLDSGGAVASPESSPSSVQVVAEPRRMRGMVVQSNGAVLSSAEVNQGDNLTLTCTGEVGHNATAGNTLKIRFCVKGSSTTGSSDFTFFGTTNTATQGELGALQNCQYNRSASVAYTVTNQYEHLQFLCESGYSIQCGTGTAKLYRNITIEMKEPQTDITDENSECNSTESGVSSETVGGIVGALLLIIAILVTVMVMRERRYRQEIGQRSKEAPISFYENNIPGSTNQLGKETPSGEADQRSNYEELQSQRDVHTYEHVGSRSGSTKDLDQSCAYEDLQSNRDVHTYDHLGNKSMDAEVR